MERLRSPLVLLVLFGIAWTQALGQQGPAIRVADLADGPAGPAPFQRSKLTVLGDRLFFYADDGMSGRELWQSDGTAFGTKQVADVCPGPCRSAPGYLSGYSIQGFFIRGPVGAGDEIFFEAEDGVRGLTLWRSDGTVSGTRPLEGLDSVHMALHGIAELTAWQDWVFFVASDPEHGLELRRAGGGEPAAELVTDLRLGPSGSGTERLVATPSGLFFTALERRDVWVSDGTAEGTRRLLGESVAGIQVETILAAGAGVLFVIRSQTTGERDLWVSDGTGGGTRRIVELGSPSVANLIQVDGRAYFQVFTVEANALWASDGTAAGTVVLGPIPGFVTGQLYTGFEGAFLYAVGSTLWSSADLGAPVPVSTFDADIDEVAAAAGALFVLTDDRVLWRSTDPSGLFQPVDVSPSVLANLTPFGGELYFWSFDDESGGQLTSVDADGDVRPVTHIEVPDSSDPSSLVNHRETLLFSTRQGLYASRGDFSSTVQVAGVSSAARATSVAGTAFIFDGPEVRSYVGAGGSTLLLPSVGRSYPDTAIEYGGKAYFVTASSPTAFSLWTSDGKPSGSAGIEIFPRLREECPGLPLTYCRLARAQTAVVNDRLLLMLEDELRSSDGRPGVSRTVFDATAVDGCEECWLNHLTRVETLAGEVVFFTSTGHQAPTRLWTSDGTAAGTELVLELAPAEGFPVPLGRFEVSPLPPPATELIGFDGKLFFARRTSELGDELWTSDGTAAGTMPVRDLRTGRASSFPRGLMASGDSLYFVAEDGIRGRELWLSDGTAVGTKRLAEPWTGANSSVPVGPIAVGGQLVFSAEDGIHGRELWRSARSGRITGLVHDIELGASSSTPRHLTVSGTRLYFNAFTAETGFELWSVPIDDLVGPDSRVNR